MKEKLKRVALTNGGLVLLGIPAAMFVTGGGLSGPDLPLLVLFGTGIMALILAAGNLLVGLIMALSDGPGSPSRQWGQAMLLCSGILLLCSGTLCTVGATMS